MTEAPCRASQRDRYLRAEVEGGVDLPRRTAVASVARVVGHDEAEAPPVEEVHGREAVGRPAGVREDDRAERPGTQPVPPEPEAFPRARRLSRPSAAARGWPGRGGRP
ncbi:hypothetical protein GCM10023347_29290 [Streptomyces chumphonensis]